MTLNKLVVLSFSLGTGYLCVLLLSQVPTLNPREQDDIELYKQVREERANQNFRIGKQAFRRLEVKYGCDASQNTVGEQ